MSLRLSAALAAGRLVAGLSRRLGRGGGTVIAGHVVPRIAPGALATVTRRLPQGSVIVSGTNGKTTTTRLIAHIARQSGLETMHNRAGANLLTGLVTTAMTGSSLRGWPSAHLGLFEVDEATLPHALAHIAPRALLLTNIFRDQLDRYGEVHYVATLWRRALATLPPETTLVLNADDPLVASLADELPNPRVFFGVDDASVAASESPHASDARLCPRCNAPLRYTAAFYGHLGHYACSACSFRRPHADVSAISVHLASERGSTVHLTLPAGELEADLPLPGLYNVYNALAASAVAECLQTSRPVLQSSLTSFQAAFGRLERVAVGDREIFLALVKNPVGFTEVLRTITGGERPLHLMIAINDLFADGTDVSWLWDVEFELLAGRVARVTCGGVRAHDMAVRLKYAGINPARITVAPELDGALDEALGGVPSGGTLYALPTYTAMLETRRLLAARGLVSGFWED
ncbi:MAG: Mur ligase family protein [Chloroflexota bacterium]